MYDCKASVLIVSYNHEQYIAQAMDSVLEQVVDFPFEIIVADDSSTDRTPQIVRSYQTRYPDRIKILESQGNLGITRNYQRGFAACSGEYIAVLEGDDYWLEKDRLSTLVGFLEAHPECSFVFNRIQLVHPQSTSLHQWDSDQPFELIDGARLAKENFIGNFSACVYPNALVRQQEARIYDLKMYDWLFNLSMSRQGPIAYLPKVMSVYRLHEQGTWSNMSMDQKVRETIDLIDTYNAFLKNVYGKPFAHHAQRLRLYLITSQFKQIQARHEQNPVIKACMLAMRAAVGLYTKFWLFITR